MAWLVSLKVMLMSAGVVSMALALKLSIPLMMEFSFSYIPFIWASVVSCLRPPYIYIIINGIIISIVASTRFQKKEADGYREIVEAGFTEPAAVHQELIAAEVKAMELEAVHEVADEVIISEAVQVEDEDKFVISPAPVWMSPETMKLSEKPLVSSRFGHRKPARASLEGGKALGVISKAKRHETLENTWKAITEGRAIPLSRHMKKCETWENHGRQMNVSLEQDEYSPVMKSKTFKDRTNQALTAADLSPLPLKLRKEPSMSQDDLNKRVENFIKKFNDEMRLQREQSLKNYWDMVNRGDK